MHVEKVDERQNELMKMKVLVVASVQPESIIIRENFDVTDDYERVGGIFHNQLPRTSGALIDTSLSSH